MDWKGFMQFHPSDKPRGEADIPRAAQRVTR